MTFYPQYYLPGGDIYLELESRYGRAGADLVAGYALRGDVEGLNQALSDLKPGGFSPGTAVLPTNTIGIFGNQLLTDPLDAPLAGLNSQIGKAVWNVLKNPFVLAIVAGVIWWKFFRK